MFHSDEYNYIENCPVINISEFFVYAQGYKVK